jgi:hypothetical protein
LEKSSRCTEADVAKATLAPESKPGDEPIYTCQATQLRNYTRPLPWWDARQYVEDYMSGNASLWRIFLGLTYVCYYYPTLSFRPKIGAPARWFYDKLQSIWRGPPFPRRRGRLPADQPGPLASLNLQPGELVRIKRFEQILQTLNARNKNRGMAFDVEEVPFCGHVYRVRNKVEKFVDERTGRLRSLRTPAVILEGVYCKSRYSAQRMFCPRSIFPWWREVWLERESQQDAQITDELEVKH